MLSHHEIRTTEGRALQAYDSGPTSDAAVVWHHSSPQTGVPLDPLLDAAAERGIRLVSYGRPSYGGSSPLPGRTVASAAGGVAQVADAVHEARAALGRLEREQSRALWQ